MPFYLPRDVHGAQRMLGEGDNAARSGAGDTFVAEVPHELITTRCAVNLDFDDQLKPRWVVAVVEAPVDPPELPLTEVLRSRSRCLDGKRQRILVEPVRDGITKVEQRRCSQPA